MAFDKPPSQNTNEKKVEKRIEKKELKMHYRLASLFRTIAIDPNIEVVTKPDPIIEKQMALQGKDAKTTWFIRNIIDPKTKKIIRRYCHIPEIILEASEEVALGSIAHEASHTHITRFSEFIPDELFKELGFGSLISSAEERPTDQFVRDNYSGAGIWVDQMRRALAEEGKDIADEYEEKYKKIPEITRFAQLGNLIVFEPHLEGLEQNYLPEVYEAYEEIRPAIEKLEHLLPPQDANEKTRVEFAKKRYVILYTEIWPVYKKLIEKDKQDEQINQLIQNNQDEIKEKLQEELEEDFKKIVENPYFIAIIEKALREFLQKFFENMETSEQKKIKDLAERALENIEDKIIEKNANSFDPFPTHEEYRKIDEEEKEKIEQERLYEAEKKQREDEEEKIKRKIENEEKKNTQKEKNVYDETYEEIRELELHLYNELEDVFRPNIKRSMRLTATGSKLNLGAVYKWDSNRKAARNNKEQKKSAVASKIFESTHIPEKKDYAITLLVDLSGSMKTNQKIEQTFKAVILLSEILNRLGIRFELIGFQDEIIELKKFDEELTDKIRKKISGILHEVWNNNPDGHNNSYYNDDGPCLIEASSRLEKELAQEKFLLVFSDGNPAGRYSTAEDLKKAISMILSETNQKLVALGLGSNTEHVETFYPTSLPNIDVKKLSELLGELLKDMIIHPEHYKYQHIV